MDNLQRQNTSLLTLWKLSWAINITGDAEIDNKDDFLVYVTIFMSTILNVILMLNMLISILGDSYDIFMVERSIIDYREKINVTLEFQTALFWRKSNNLFMLWLLLLKMKKTQMIGKEDLILVTRSRKVEAKNC